MAFKDLEAKRAYHREYHRKWRAIHRPRKPRPPKQTPEERREKARLAMAKKRCEHPEKMRAQFAAWREKNREHIRAYKRASHTRHRDKVNERCRLWHMHNQDKVQAYRQKRYREQREEILAKNRQRYQVNKDKISAANKAWRAANKDKIRAYWQANPEILQQKRARRRAAKQNSPINDLTREQWNEIKGAYGFRCVYCGRKMQRLTMDHIVPLSKGGAHTASNVVPACASCNASKGNRAPLKPVQPLLLTVAPLKKKRS